MTQINKPKMEMEEMVSLYKKRRPFEPNQVRVGKFAKYLGYVLQHQMTRGKLHSFYVKKELLEEGF